MGEEIKLTTKSLTMLLEAGNLPLELLHAVDGLAGKYGLRVYLSTAQNLRLMGIPEEALAAVQGELAAKGAIFKGPGKFPMPKVCIGKQDCNLGLVDTAELSRKIMAIFGSRQNVKPKFKIAIAGCPASCANAQLVDIGVVATRNGYDIYAGGKGGPLPKVGRRIVRQADEARVLEVVGQLVDFHGAKTSKKQRMAKLLGDSEFPYPEAF